MFRKTIFILFYLVLFVFQLEYNVGFTAGPLRWALNIKKQ